VNQGCCRGLTLPVVTTDPVVTPPKVSRPLQILICHAVTPESPPPYKHWPESALPAVSTASLVTPAKEPKPLQTLTCHRVTLKPPPPPGGENLPPIALVLRHGLNPSPSLSLNLDLAPSRVSRATFFRHPPDLCALLWQSLQVSPLILPFLLVRVSSVFACFSLLQPLTSGVVFP